MHVYTFLIVCVCARYVFAYVYKYMQIYVHVNTKSLHGTTNMHTYFRTSTSKGINTKNQP